MNKYGVYIGRFQPFHNAHLETIKFALERVEKLIIVIGSTNQARTVKNPWTFDERKTMIISSLSPKEQQRVHFIAAKDYLYNDNMWIISIQREVDDITGAIHPDDIYLFGHVKSKDTSTFYLKMFRWDFIDTNINSDLAATKVRFMYFTYDNCYNSLVPPPVAKQMNDFASEKGRGLLRGFQELKLEFDHVLRYKLEWSDAPFPPTFVTTDAIVVKSGHILVVKRKCSPGKGLLALPGGFLSQNERIIDGCIRELKEETGINLPTHELKKMVCDQHVFDHPERSLRGRTITHAFCINLGHGELPKVKGSDDAEKASWMPFSEAFTRENEFFEDHISIIQFFTNRF